MEIEEQAPVEDTPDVVVEEQPEPIVNWEQRYNDLRPEFDRRAQEAAELKQLLEGIHSEDLHTRRAAAEHLGIEFIEPEDEYEESGAYQDPTVQRLEALERRFEAQREAERAAAEDQFLEQATAVVEQQLESLPVDPEDRDWILARALTLQKTPDGLPDIEAAYDLFNQAEAGRKKKWAGTKKGSYVSSVGASGTQVPDLDDDQQRVAWMVERARSLAED